MKTNILLTSRVNLPTKGMPVRSACFCPRGENGSKWIATGSDDGVARIWDITTGNIVVSLSGHDLAINSVR